MKKLVFLFILLWCFKSNAQNQWFQTYSDSILLVIDANAIVQDFANKVEKINPNIQLKIKNEIFKLSHNKAIKNTTPYLIYIDSTIINLPFWDELIPEQKDFFADVDGGKNEGKEVFGLFFNGFYLTHELGHSLFAFAGKHFDNAYDNEFAANKLAILYWMAVGEDNNLNKCYLYAKKMLNTLKNPVPPNENYKDYISLNYYQLASDPYKYSYIQFSQFIEIYEDEDLPSFEDFIKNVNKK